jgi:hypothetical protein
VVVVFGAGEGEGALVVGLTVDAGWEVGERVLFKSFFKASTMSVTKCEPSSMLGVADGEEVLLGPRVVVIVGLALVAVLLVFEEDLRAAVVEVTVGLTLLLLLLPAVGAAVVVAVLVVGTKDE